MEHKFINQIQPGERIDDIYLVTDPILRSTSRGDLYIAMFLCDKTGQLNGRMWQASEMVYSSLPKPGFVRVQGRSELYQGNMQIIINSINVVDSEAVNLEDFLARTNNDVEQMFGQAKQIVGQIKNPQLEMLIEEFLSDDELMDKFCKMPAGAKMHHNYLGGLLEHTHNMLQAAVAILPLYPQVQADLVLAGIFLHDIGKVEELSCDIAFSYTDTGQLMGHITLGVLMVNQKADLLAAKGKPIDRVILDSLCHLILAHHSKYEFGSPKLPATLEAFMVCYLDDLDAKLNQVAIAIDNEQGDSNWTGWKKALETRLYRKRIDQ